MSQEVIDAAKYLFDNRLGWSEGRNPYAPRYFWWKLGCALYGNNVDFVKELEGDSPKGERSEHGI